MSPSDPNFPTCESLDDPGDRDLLTELRTGSETAATRLYERYARRLLALAQKNTGLDLANRFDPDDIVQSVFGSFFRKAKNGLYDVPDSGNLWPLLLVIAMQKIRAFGAFHRAKCRDVGREQRGQSDAIVQALARIEAREDQLAGTTVASPSLGNTQDVALRAWLADEGFETRPDGGGDLTILAQSNSTTLESFVAGKIDGAWVPEPWATRLILEGGGHVLVDERDLWPATNGEYVTTHLIVTTEFLAAHPDVVKALLAGVVEANDFVNADATAAQAVVNEGIKDVTDKALPEEVLAAAWPNLKFTVDPIASSLQMSATEAIELGLLDQVDLTGIYDLTLLNEVLTEAGKPAIAVP